MLEILQLYVSGFWVWLGITVGLWVVANVMLVVLAVIVDAFRRRGG